MRWKPAILDRSRPAVRASEWGALTALVVMLFTFLVVFGGWRNRPSSWQEILECNRQIDWGGLWGFDPLRTAIFVGLAAGLLVRFLILLRSARCWALDPNAMPSDLEDGSKGFAVHPLNIPDVASAGYEHKSGILNAFVRCSDLTMSHAAFLPPGTILRDVDQAPGPGNRLALADLPEELGKYVAQYAGPHNGSFRVDRLSDRRMAWFKDRRIYDLLAGNSNKEAISVDSTLKDLFIGLSGSFPYESMVRAGLLAEPAPGHFEPPPALVQDAAIFPHYDQHGRTVALSHSISPILGGDCDDMMWDRREIHKAGQDGGVLFITSGIHFGLHLRSSGHHAIAIHPHVWAHPELAGSWPLPRFFSAKLRYGDYSDSLRRVERFAHWLTRQICEAGVRKVYYDLSSKYTVLTDDDTLTHQAMVRFLFRHFVSRFLAPGLKAAGIEVDTPPLLWWSIIRSGFTGKRPNGSPTYVLDHDSFCDLDGESVLFELSPPILNTDEVHLEPDVDSPPGPENYDTPARQVVVEEPAPAPEDDDEILHQTVPAPTAPESTETLEAPAEADAMPALVSDAQAIPAEPPAPAPAPMPSGDIGAKINATAGSRPAPEHYPCKMIQRQNGKWLVVFGSECKTFRNSHGLRYMAALLSHPNMYISAKDLYDIYGDKFPSANAWAPAPREELEGKGLPIRWQRTPGLILWHKKRHLGLIKQEQSLFDDQYTPGEEYETADSGRGLSIRRHRDFDHIRAKLAERQKFTEKEIAVLTAINTANPFVWRVGRNLRTAQERFAAEDMVLLVCYIEDTLAPFEFIRLGFKPERGNPPGLEWTIKWANSTHIDSASLADIESDESDEADKSEEADESDESDEFEEADDRKNE